METSFGRSPKSIRFRSNVGCSGDNPPELEKRVEIEDEGEGLEEQ